MGIAAVAVSFRVLEHLLLVLRVVAGEEVVLVSAAGGASIFVFVHKVDGLGQDLPQRLLNSLILQAVLYLLPISIILALHPQRLINSITFMRRDQSTLLLLFQLYMSGGRHRVLLLSCFDLIHEGFALDLPKLFNVHRFLRFECLFLPFFLLLDQ